MTGKLKMCSYLRKLFCCLPNPQVDRQAPYIASSVSSVNEDFEDTIYFRVPRKEFSVFFEKDLKFWELDISGFMSLYKYATDNLVRKPGPDYKYAMFEFRADDRYVKVEGWVPVDIFNVKPGNVTIISKPVVESKLSTRNIVSVDVKGNISEERKVVAKQDASHFRIKASSSSKAPARSGVSTYSRHMSEF